jgi:CheY-like chemotaxis protein
MTEATILLVDDEPNVLASLSLNLKRRYTVLTANDGAQGLERLNDQGTVAVIVSDLHMPGMDGGAFLARARKLVPTAVRILLTGQADVSSAISAVNDGQIFRFLTKPTPTAVFLTVIEAAVAQHRLITSEKVLLEQTLRGSLRTMTEILALASPMLFGRALRVKRTVGDLGRKLAITDYWQIEVAVMLSQVAQISLPGETAEKLCRAAELSADEHAMVARMPEITDQLLAHIPRLETVRVMLANSQEPIRRSTCIQPEAEAGLVDIGAKLIKAAVAFDVLTQSGLSDADAVSVLRGEPKRFDRDVVAALGELYASADAQYEIVEIAVDGLVPGMVLAEDLKSRTGMLLVARGFEVTPTFMERIRNYRPGSVEESVRVIRRGTPAAPPI